MKYIFKGQISFKFGIKTFIKSHSCEALGGIMKMTNWRTLLIPSLGALSKPGRYLSGKYFLLFAIIAEVLVTMTTRPQLCFVLRAEATTMSFVDKSSPGTMAGNVV